MAPVAHAGRLSCSGSGWGARRDMICPGTAASARVAALDSVDERKNGGAGRGRENADARRSTGVGFIRDSRHGRGIGRVGNEDVIALEASDRAPRVIAKDADTKPAAAQAEVSHLVQDVV
jgi:hypothetical protein